MIPIPGKSTLIVGGVLALAVGVQTFRLNSAETTIAQQEAQAAALATSIATARLEGVQEGQKQQKEAQDEIVAAHKAIEAGLLADAAERNVQNAKAMDAVSKALAGDQWKCLRDPLPPAALDVYRRNGT